MDKAKSKDHVTVDQRGCGSARASAFPLLCGRWCADRRQGFVLAFRESCGAGNTGGLPPVSCWIDQRNSIAIRRRRLGRLPSMRPSGEMGARCRYRRGGPPNVANCRSARCRAERTRPAKPVERPNVSSRDSPSQGQLPFLVAFGRNRTPPNAGNHARPQKSSSRNWRSHRWPRRWGAAPLGDVHNGHGSR